jgi:adenosylcobinamide amidohydrolase
MATIVQFLTTAASESASSGKTIKMYIGQNGGLVVGNAAGGDMGPGTINIAAGVYVNGIQLTVP